MNWQMQIHQNLNSLFSECNLIKVDLPFCHLRSYDTAYSGMECERGSLFSIAILSIWLTGPMEIATNPLDSNRKFPLSGAKIQFPFRNEIFNLIEFNVWYAFDWIWRFILDMCLCEMQKKDQKRKEKKIH